MMRSAYRLRIFGKAVEIALDDSAAADILARELSLYQSSDGGEPLSLRIEYGDVPTPTVGLANPSIHHELPHGFLARYGGASVRWEFGSTTPLVVGLHVASPKSRMRDAIGRFRNIQYCTPSESIGQLLHELVLVPSIYFDPGYFLLHAAAFQEPGGGVIAVGGTGGVGKTSLSIELCLRRGFRFVADDITVVDSAGHVWPNLAFPKIYGYNVVGDAELRRLILQGRSALDIANWHLRKKRGLANVRRRVSPQELYGSYSHSGGLLKRYVFLAREHRDDFHVCEVTGRELAALSVPVLKAEYGAFHQHLYWHEVNRRLDGSVPAIRPAAVFQRWEQLATTVLDRVECLVVRGPMRARHSDFIRTAASLIGGGGIA